MAVVSGKRKARKAALFFAGEKHGPRIAQHSAFNHPPADALLQMFPRIGLLEVGIEHAVRENEVRHAHAAQPSPDAGASVAPETVNHDGIEVPGSLRDPRG